MMTSWCEDVGCHCLGLLWSIIGVTFVAALEVTLIELSLIQSMENCFMNRTCFIQTIFAFYKDGSNLPMGQTILSRDTNLSYQKHFKEPQKSFLRNFIEDTWENNIVPMLLYPDLNLLKMFANTMQTIFDEDWLNWSKWTIRVNPYCLRLLIVRDVLK